MTSKLVDTLLQFFRQYQAIQRERERGTGKPTKKADPPARRVEHGIRVEYTPDMDGDADPGEVVWAWVPFEEDPTLGKDRPVVVIGRSGGDFAVVPLTSKNKGRNDHVPVGSGSWDPDGRPSWAKVDRLVVVRPADVRREGAILDEHRFDEVVGGLARYHDLVRR